MVAVSDIMKKMIVLCNGNSSCGDLKDCNEVMVGIAVEVVEVKSLMIKTILTFCAVLH